jgi:hypothetical protein
MWLCHNENDDIEVRDPEMPLKVLYIIKKEDLDPAQYVIDYGKWNGNNLSKINIEDPAYIQFLKDTSPDLLLKQCLEKLI